MAKKSESGKQKGPTCLECGAIIDGHGMAHIFQPASIEKAPAKTAGWVSALQCEEAWLELKRAKKAADPERLAVAKRRHEELVAIYLAQ